MQNNDPKPPTKFSGNQPPPRPPKNTAIASGPDDEGDPGGKNSKNKTVRINLLPKPGAAPTIKLPTLPPGKSAFESVKLTQKAAIPDLSPAARRQSRKIQTLDLGMILAAVLALNGMLYVLCRL